MQHILVCAQDSVLAKKVRFLLANDQCDVEILDASGELDQRLSQNDVDLLVLGRDVDGEDAIELLGRINPSVVIPPTLVLGGPDAVTADFIHLIPDPIDTQAIYKIASDILSGDAHMDTSDEETLMALKRPDLRGQTVAEQDKTAEVGLPAPGGEEELKYSDVTGLDEIAGRLDQLESDQLSEQLSDAFDIDDAGDGGAAPRRPAPKPVSPIPSGALDPARLAKVLHQCGTKAVNGVLIVARDEETSTIYMEQGSPVHIESSIPGDQLGKALVNRGRVTDAQYADGAKRAIERGVPLGQALVDLGFFTNEELGTELGNTARDRIVACFAARTGSVDFDPNRAPPSADRPYRLQVPHIIAQGLRTHADDAVLNGIMGDANDRYFKLSQPISDLAEIYPLSGQDKDFLAFSGRAYNITDAAESSGLTMQDAYQLLALLSTCEDLSDFTPGVKEFEDRIKEEQRRVKDLQSSLPQTASSLPTPPPASTPPQPSSAPALPPMPTAAPEPTPAAAQPPVVSDSDRTIAGGGPPAMPPPVGGDSNPFGWGDAPQEAAPPPPPPPAPPPAPPPFAAAPPPSPPPPMPAAPAAAPAAPAAPAPAEDVPPMPVPADGSAGMTPRPLVYAKPLPRGQDGQVLETSERTLSREHFQRGVTLLGQGNFANAEEAFRDAVALCSEEHVYLIGLARAIYYNPGYGAAGKVPVLRGIVDRARQLAPEDKRVETLSSWVHFAETQL